MNYIRAVVFLLLASGGPVFTDAQTDSSSDSVDTLEEILSAGEEKLLEESPGLDGNSILDLASDTISNRGPRNHIFMRTRFSHRLQASYGDESGSFEGTRLKSSQKLNAVFGNFSGGMLIAKGPGEKSTEGFITGNLSYRGAGALRQFALGDYRIEAGQGIAAWKGRDVSKGSDILTPIVRSGRGILTSLSPDESSYMRGGVVTLGVKQATATLMYSDRFYGATLDSNGGIRSLYTSGIYRTSSELQKRNAVGEKLYGARITVSAGGDDYFGLTAYRAGFTRRGRSEVPPAAFHYGGKEFASF